MKIKYRYQSYSALFITVTFITVVSALSPLYAQEPNTAAKAAETEEPESVEESDPSKPVRPPSTAPRPQYPASEKGQMQLLASTLPPEGLVWVEHYPESFLGYWQRDRSGDAKGALLILHAEGTSPVWPTTTLPLHRTLPDYGWATFAISVPDPGARATPKRAWPTKVMPKKPEIDTEVANDEPPSEDLKSTETELTQTSVAPIIEVTDSGDNSNSNTTPPQLMTEQRLESALRFLHDRGQFNIVIVSGGMNTIPAKNFLDKITPNIEDPQLRKQIEKPIRAVIMLNGKNELLNAEDRFDQWFTDVDLPVLDIYFRNDPRNIHDAKFRKTLATQRGIEDYQQVAMMGMSGEQSWGENRLSRRIRGFLEKNASGIEVDGMLKKR